MVHKSGDSNTRSWNARFAIPDDVLAAVGSSWPKARLHVTNYYRPDRKETPYIPLDMKLLSSPQLHCLNYTAYGRWVLRPDHTREFRSELSALKSCLLQATGLKHLHLHLEEYTVHEKRTSWVPGPRNLNFENDESFPALETISVTHERYELSESHCQQLAAMNWSHLRCLLLDRGSPKHLFAALTGQITQLKILEFGFWPNPNPNSTWDSGDTANVQRFLDSIAGLEEVNIQCYFEDQFNEIRDSLLKKHGPTLRKLHANVSHGQAKGWDPTDVRRLVEQCPGLRDLYLTLAMVEEHTADGQRTVWVRFTSHYVLDAS